MNMVNQNPAEIIILTGPQGCGKGTLGKKLAKKYGYKIISTGDLIRALPDNDERKIWVNKGNLLADEQIYEMIKEFIKPDEKIIFDGFPRTLAQAKWLYSLQEQGIVKIQKTLYISISKENANKRILKRGVLEHRVDDMDPIAVAMRLEKFYKNTLPAIRYLYKNGIDTVKFRVKKPNASANENFLHFDSAITKHDIQKAKNIMRLNQLALVAQNIRA